SSTSASRIAQAIRYTADSGARVANASWGGGGGFNGDVIYSAIQYAGTKGQLFVTAAGNDGQDLDSLFFSEFPTEYALSNIVAVAATTSAGRLASFSNFGDLAVDVAAPGSGILSTIPGNRYATLSGTSMATPMVTGTVALMLSADKSLTASQLKQRLIAGADESVALSGLTASGGELNVNNAVRGAAGVSLAFSTTAIAAPRGVGDVLTQALRTESARD